MHYERILIELDEGGWVRFTRPHGYPGGYSRASLEIPQGFTFNDQPVRWDLLLPGHGAMAMDRAYLDIEKGREILAGDVAAERDVSTSPYPRPEYRKRMFGRPAIP